MILLASLGYEDAFMWEKLTELYGKKPQSACFITNASAMLGNSVAAHKLSKTFDNIGFPIPSYIDLEKQDSKMLKDFELIVLLGGNSERLFKAIHKARAISILKDHVLKGRLLAGISAGAMFLSSGNAHCLQIDPLLGIDQGFEASSIHDGMEYLKYCVLPHMGRFLEIRPELEIELAKIQDEMDIRIKQMFDGEYIIIDQGEIIFEFENSPKIASA